LFWAYILQVYIVQTGSKIIQDYFGPLKPEVLLRFTKELNLLNMP